MGRIPEGAQLAFEIVARTYHAKRLELGAIDVAALALRLARQLLPAERLCHHPLEQLEQPVLASKVERERGLGPPVDWESHHLDHVARVEGLVDEVTRDAPLGPALEDRHVVAAEPPKVRQRRRVKVEAADTAERKERLADPLPEEKRDDDVHI